MQLKAGRPHQMWATDASYFRVIGWGLYYLVTVMDDYSRFKAVRGRIAQIRNQGSGEIELRSGLRVFFIPARGHVPGGYVGQDIGREVEFFLGFSYDGLRAWSIGDPQTTSRQGPRREDDPHLVR